MTPSSDAVPAAEPPLAGIRVVDFSRVLAGPYCTAMLADLGADVIKIEPPGGDDQRSMGVIREGESANFALINRSKRSLVLDLKAPEGQRIAGDLAAHADVVVENFRPGVAARLGIGAEALCASNPRLVYVSISGFGQDGPLADRPSYDVITQAMTGLMSLTGTADGPPMLVGESIADVSAGIFAAFATTTALYQRERTGHGQHIDVAMFDSLLSMMPTAMARYLGEGKVPTRHGNRHALTAPFGAYRAADGHFMLAVANNALFKRLALAIGRPDWADSPDFGNVKARAARRDVLAEGIEAWASSRNVAEIVEQLLDAGVPASPIWDAGQAIDSDQAAHRGLFRPVAHPAFEGLRAPRQPAHFSGGTTLPPRPAPALGADGDAILAELLDFPPERIADLRARGII